jgi:hypothetical protein
MEKNKGKEKIELGYKNKYLPIFLDLFEIPYLSIYKDEYGNIKIYKKGRDFKIIIFHKNYIPFFEDMYSDYEFDIKTLLEGFKLDSILLNNFTERKYNKGHSITGITCGGERFVYNGLKRKKESYKFCNLIPFDWYLSKEDFCLNPECILDKKEDAKYCFSFKRGERIFIYVKIEEEKEEKLRTKIKNFELNIRDIKKGFPSNEIMSIANISSKSSIHKSPLNTDIFKNDFTKNFLISLETFNKKLYHLYKEIINEDELKDEELNELLEFLNNKKKRTKLLSLLTEEDFIYLNSKFNDFNQGHP